MTLRVVCVYTSATALRGRAHAEGLRTTRAPLEVVELNVWDADPTTIRRLAASRPVVVAHGAATLGIATFVARSPSAVILDLADTRPARAVKALSAPLLRRLGGLTADSPATAAAAQDAFGLAALPVVTDGEAATGGALLRELACRVAAGRPPGRGRAVRVAARRARADDLASRARAIKSDHPARSAAALLTEAAARGAAALGRRDIAQATLSRAWTRTGHGGVGLALERFIRADGATADAILHDLVAAGSVDPAHRATAAIRLIARGDAETARRLAGQLEETATPDALAAAALIRSALGMREPAVSLARAASRRAAGEEPVRATEVAVLEQAGEPRAALAAAGGNTLGGARRRLAGTLRAYDTGWLPQLSAQQPPATASEGRVLNLLEASLPHAPSGYAYRSRTILEAQRRLGLRPVAATRLG